MLFSNRDGAIKSRSVVDRGVSSDKVGVMAKSFDFPVWLKGTKEQQEAETERQRLALAAHSRGHLSDAERLVGRGVLLEQTARQNLEIAKGRNKEARILAQNQLAEGLALQGKYAEAAETHTDRVTRKYYRDIVRAINKPDEDRCKCKDSQAKMNGVDLSITPRFERDKVFSPVHGKIVSLVECSKCGDLNARPLKSRLIPMQGALQESEANKKPIRSDAQLLNATS